MGFYPDIGGGGDDNDGGWIAGCLRLSGENLKYWSKVVSLSSELGSDLTAEQVLQ